MRVSYEVVAMPVDSGAVTAIEMVISKREYSETNPSRGRVIMGDCYFLRTVYTQILARAWVTASDALTGSKQWQNRAGLRPARIT